MSFFLFYSGVTEPLMKREVDTKLERVKCQVNLISFTAAAAWSLFVEVWWDTINQNKAGSYRERPYVLFEILDDLKPIIRKIRVLITSNEKLLWMNPGIKLWRIKWASFPKSSWDFQQNNFD